MHGQPVFAVARPDGRQVWVNFAPNDTVQVIDVPSRAIIRALTPGKAVMHLEFRPRSEQAWISVRDEDRVDVYDAARFTRLASIPADKPSGIFLTARANRTGSDMHGSDPTTTVAQRFSARFPVRAPALRALGGCARHREHDVLAMLADLKAEEDRPRRRHRPAKQHRREHWRRCGWGSAGRSGGGRQPPAGGESLLQREHEINLWFVVIAADRPRYCAFSMRSRRRRESGARPADLALPHRSGLRPAMRADTDRHILAGIERAAAEPRPYQDVAARLGISEELIGRLQALLETG